MFCVAIVSLQRHIAWFPKCTSFQMINIYFIRVKSGLQSNCDTRKLMSLAAPGWCESDLDSAKFFKSVRGCTETVTSCNIIKIFEFSTLYTAIPHSKLKYRSTELLQLCFMKKNGQRRYTYVA